LLLSRLSYSHLELLAAIVEPRMKKAAAACASLAIRASARDFGPVPALIFSRIEERSLKAFSAVQPSEAHPAASSFTLPSTL
jgi:hypothetical protein